MRLADLPLPVIALAALALALAIGRADGSDPAASEPVVEPVRKATEAAKEKEAAPLLALERPRRAPDAPVGDLFEGRSWVPKPVPAAVPAAPIVVPPPPKPTAPALPFAYIGRLEEEGAKTVVYLQRGERLLEVGTGDVVDGDYRVEALTEDELVLVFLPLGEKQSLRIRSER